MSLKRAAIINGISRFSKIFIQLVVNAILARILSPAEYGVVAIITVFSTFFNTFADMGFGPAIIQNKDLDERDIGHIYTLTIYIGIALALLFSFISIPIAAFYENSSYLRIGPFLSLSLFFNTINMIPNSILMRNKQFIAVAVRTVVVYLGGGVIAIVLASLGFSYYSLIFQTVIISAASYIWNYLSTKPKFTFKVDKTVIDKVKQFSLYQFMFNMINYFSRNLDNLLTGKLLGDVQLAYYDKAYTLMLYPVNNLTGVISPVLHPILSDYQNSPEIIYRSYISVSKILGIIGAFVSAICFIAPREIILIVYGPQWENSVFCFKILGLVVASQMLNSSSGAIFQSLGNTKLLFTSGIINTLITIGMILVGLLGGKSIEALSICVAIAYLLHYILAQILIIRNGFHFNFSRYCKDLSKEFIIYSGLILVCLLFRFNFQNIFISLIIKGVWVGIFLIILLALTKEYKVLLGFFKRKSKS